ncbi:hypothetical protein [Streptomyces sp. HD]|uniref:hypothetical protein n=1 Tax=Streptomyces sp. HD TaxID=3020892 RepID=UPI00232AED50|nr:hypothetical protein [Streptomyces sp. HD]MDC0772671.1 hypothetical protein [Streptomyces sp. HD]
MEAAPTEFTALEATAMEAAATDAATATATLLHLARQAPPADPEQLADRLDATAAQLGATLTHLTALCTTLRDATPLSFHHRQLALCADHLTRATATWNQLRADRTCPGVM